MARSQPTIQEGNRHSNGRQELGPVCRLSFYRFNVFLIIYFASAVTAFLALILYATLH